MRIADVLTSLRVVAAPIVMWLILSGETLAAYYLFAAAAMTDLLDGYFARRSAKVVQYGETFDGLADITLVMLTTLAVFIRGDGLWLFVVGLISFLLAVPALSLISIKKGRVSIPHLHTNMLAAFVYPAIMAYIIGWHYSLPLLLVAFAVGLYTFRNYVAYVRSGLRRPDN